LSERDFRTTPLNILIVDDDLGFAESLRMFLESDGRMNVLGIASNLREALTHARQGAYDLALVDVRLMEGDGFGVVSALRDLDPNLVSVMMSASTLTSTARKLSGRAPRGCSRSPTWFDAAVIRSSTPT
jgi:DNA-binding NarL/FixJ family response regulator